MLEIIRHKLETNVCDEVMEIAWSTMWNVTGKSIADPVFVCTMQYGIPGKVWNSTFRFLRS